MEKIKEVLDFSIAGFSVGNLLWALLLLALCLIAVRLLMVLVRRFMGRTHLEAGLRSFTVSIIQILLYFLTLVLVADSLGIPISSLLAIFSVVGLAASLAMQDTLANVASGIMILVAKPFKVNDFIECGSTMGTVKNISLVYTSLTTSDNRMVFIPNKDISAARVTNFYHESTRRVNLLFPASYDAPTKTVKEALLHAAQQIPDVLWGEAAPEPPFAGLNEYQSSCIQYVLRVWVPAHKYWDVHFALNEQVRESFAQYGVEISYDHLNVHIMDKAN